jgi:hypothetical protein
MATISYYLARGIIFFPNVASTSRISSSEVATILYEHGASIMEKLIYERWCEVCPDYWIARLLDRDLSSL